MEKKEQFDEFLGGTESLPIDVSIMKLAKARAGEILSMTRTLENPRQTKLIFQRLPIHMRRRVMSHNAKRLPRKLREAHISQMGKSGLPPKTKRPSRKYRRRPSNLLLEYNRRQRNKMWLETHIWHAKRFHMTEQWGYKIADFANDKCFKANFRSIIHHCLIQDLSYYSCIEIIGPENILKETLKSHCNPTTLTFAAIMYVNGMREGTVTFFKKNSFPLHPIGNVHFLWRPNFCDRRTIWIWVHPAFYDDFLTEIISSFNFNPCITEESTSSNQLQNSYINENNCQMNLLKGTLNRFRLCGPLALSVLTNSLKLFDMNKNLSTTNDESNKDCEDVTENKKDTLMVTDSWYKDYYDDQENSKAFKIQEQLWQALQSLDSPNQLPPNMVFGLTVLDPRFYLPGKRTKTDKLSTHFEKIYNPPAYVNNSPIWDQNLRERISKSCVATGLINKLRSNNLVPGVSNDNLFKQDIMAKIPILVIQNPGGFIRGLGSGIDIIIPSRWAMPFWLGFILRCARVGALRESKLIALETLNTNSPDINEPDTSAYKKEALITKEKLEKKYFRYPSNRRVNFTKFAISSPFYCQWNILMKEWSGKEDFYILRNRTTLNQLQMNLSSIKSKKRKIPISKINLDDALNNENCLIRVRISTVNKGCLRTFAIICEPTDSDLQQLKNNKRWSGPTEKLNKDPNESRRKILRKNHLLLLKRYRKQRIRHRKMLENKISNTFDEIIKGKNDVVEIKNLRQKLLNKSRKAVLEHFQIMSKLYLPDCKEVRKSCDREVMGYVTQGHFSLSIGQTIGIGYVTIQSVISMINRQSNIVLVRNNRTRKYRCAHLEILFE
ncbi:PREDICTED: ribonucleases P/MRP protein subunit POP1 [Polistes dominula]|uniref:Ribonucleases P/MRP protein subunit POP1 n=1 Tax=Polistes dominula TaxID=743375 RepID=A0ABM1JD26_POLDO|nr:PREDICTED: ribonucleases P/MRP protein subunit POP1 [Polistes dominula]